MKQQHAPLPAVPVELFPVAHVVVDAEGRLAFANARAQEILGVGAEHIGQPLEALGMLSMGAGELRRLVEQAHATRGALMRVAVQRRAGGAGPELLDIIAVPLRDPADAPLGTAIIVQHSRQAPADREIETANQELKGANEALESLNAQLQAANESLRERLADLERRAAGREDEGTAAQ
jgi:two-component system CheB/CheR fusion protein